LKYDNRIISCAMGQETMACWLGQRIWVAGGSGFLGSHVVKEIEKAGGETTRG